MKTTVTSRKPRNPFVAVSLQRLAGPHGRGNAHVQARRAGREEIRRELQGALLGAPQRGAQREHEPHSP